MSGEYTILNYNASQLRHSTKLVLITLIKDLLKNVIRLIKKLINKII